MQLTGSADGSAGYLRHILSRWKGMRGGGSENRICAGRSQWLFLGFFLPVLALLVAIGWMQWREILQLQENADWTLHSQEVQKVANRLLVSIQDIETGERGFLISGQLEFLKPYEEAKGKVFQQFEELRALTKDSPLQKSNEEELSLLWEKREALIQKIIDLGLNAQLDAARAEVASGRGNAIMDQIRKVIHRIDDEEQRVLDLRAMISERELKETFRITVLGVLVSLLLLLGAFLVVLRENRIRLRKENELLSANENLENRVQSRIVELAAANKELEAFCYSVSHDLRAPLRSIDGFSQILLEDYSDKLDEEGRDSLNRVRAATQRMGQLIDDLLKLSRLSRGEMRHEDVDLSAIAAETAEDLKAQEPGRLVDWVIQPGLVVNADPTLLRVVMENLLGNAWKFTGRQARPRIEFGSTIEDGTRVYFVRDNGVGFDPTYANKLFGAFQRLHAVSDFPGTGIGLATVRRILNRHGGAVWAESQPDHGATFYFTVPDQPKNKP